MRDFHDPGVDLPVESNFECADGGDHDWPAELDADAKCGKCHLAYSEWSED